MKQRLYMYAKKQLERRKKGEVDKKIHGAVAAQRVARATKDEKARSNALAHVRKDVWRKKERMLSLSLDSIA